MSGFKVLKPGVPHDPETTDTGFSRIKRPLKGQYYNPDTVEVMEPRPSTRTRAGSLTSNVSGYESYHTTGYIFPAYTYLATGRFFSTRVSPGEYGDAEVFDGLIALIHTKGFPEEALDYLRPTAVVKVTRQGYTEPGKLYRIDTGNPYADHVEMKLVPLVL